ncbi:pseudouridine synthase [Senegalia massiliensis]|uniref:Pseudouridine synthase n=1 Tax=Senegalia massiliensis TaxID=1720316 RepID=A0A845QVZ8_9CLOT|nr:pseudouridine synthase [Senegalia massiliensis]NBI05318.1 rRNA pseudouridine synthase [Senegalia massiliensis]
MSKKERIDKILANLGYGSRKDIKKNIKSGMVKVNNEVIKNNSIKIDPYKENIKFKNKKINYRKFIYLMLNKPSGVISATEDNHSKTVIDLIDDEYKAFNPFPVGRLDKDTEGLLILTNDGDLAHKLLSPKKHVDKKYYVKVEGYLDENDKTAFKEGLDIGEKNITLPAELDIKKSNEISECYVIIREGKFHQIKRMFISLGKKVIYLKRISMGNVELDSNLKLGEYRELTSKEIDILNR